MPRDVPPRRKPSTTASPDAAVRTLDDLLCRLSDAAKAPPVPRAELVAALAQIDPEQAGDLPQAIENQLGCALSPVQAGRLKLAADVFRAFTGQPLFHPQLAGRLRHHCSGFLVCALDNPGWLLDDADPLHELAGLIADQASGWCPEHVRATEVADALVDWLQALGAGDAPQSVLERAHGWQAQVDQRQQILASRLIQAEVGGLKLARVRERVAGTVSRLVAGRQLPDFIVRQVMDQWLPGLQWLLLQQGEQGAEWPGVTRLFGLLVWSLQPDLADGPAAEKWQRVAAEVRQALPEVLPRFIRDEQTCSMIEEQVVMAHLAMQGGREMTYQNLPALQGASLLDAVDAQLSRDLIDEINSLSDQTWFVDAQDNRFRLLLKDATYQQLVFVNQAGIKVLSSNYDDFALKLSTGEVRALTDHESLWSLLGARLEVLRADARTVAAARQQQQEREQARQQALQEAERLELAQQQVQAQAESVANAARAQQRQKMRLRLSGLPLGSWIDFAAEQGPVRLKLAVILPSSGKYVFVDGQGGNRQAFSRDELLDQVMSGAVSFIGEDLRFDDTLDRLVDGWAK